MKEMIAYRDIDSERDVWNERAFLFTDRESVEKFFTADNEKLIEIYGEGHEELQNFEAVKSNSGFITSVEFNTVYAGEVKIREMNEGYLIG